MARRRNPLWYVIITMFLSSVLVGAAAGYLADRRSTERDRLWCSALTTIVEGFRAPASDGTPPTERGLLLADSLDTVRRGYGCPK